jgi:hypothetical protein
MENLYSIEDKDFVRLQELGYLKNRPFKFPTPEEVFGLLEADEEKLKQESCYKTLSLLKDMLRISFRYDKGKYVTVPFMSCVIDGEFHSTLLPKNITPEQAEILFRNLERIESFYIKAKVADILFVSKKICDKDKLTAAEIAIEAYFNSVDYFLHKIINRKYLNASTHLERAATITLSLGKREEILFNKLEEILFNKLMEFFKREEFFKEDKSCVLITSLGKIICRIKNLSADKISLALEEYVKIFKISNPADTLLVTGRGRNIWDIGVKLSKKAKNLNYERYFNKQKGDAHCGMAECFCKNPYKRGYHIKNAIRYYRNVPEMKDKREQLKNER